MQNHINEIITQINEKGERLCVKVERMIDVKGLPPTSVMSVASPQKGNTEKFLFVAAAGLAVIGAVIKDVRTFCLFGAAVAAGTGVFMLRKNDKKEMPETGTGQDISFIKTRLMSDVISVSKMVASEWDTFMQTRHEDVRQSINRYVVDAQQKENLFSKVYYYEVVKIPLSSLNEIIDTLNETNGEEVKKKLVDEICLCIRNTVRCQIDCYKSLLI